MCKCILLPNNKGFQPTKITPSMSTRALFEYHTNQLIKMTSHNNHSPICIQHPNITQKSNVQSFNKKPVQNARVNGICLSIDNGENVEF